MNRHRLNPELTARSDNPESDFSPIRNENFLKHSAQPMGSKKTTEVSAGNLSRLPAVKDES
jgi:hypothetical protein